jgi:hypothetical protein
MVNLQSTTHWQPSYSHQERYRAVDAILIIWAELLLYTVQFERLAKLMTDNRVVIGRSLQAIADNFDIVVILVMWIACLVRCLNDCAIAYQGADRWIEWRISNWQMTPVRGIG